MAPPAQASGAGSTADSPSGIRASALAGAITYSAYPPGNVAPVTMPTSQCTNSPRRQLRQFPQYPPARPDDRDPLTFAPAIHTLADRVDAPGDLVTGRDR